MANKLAMYNIIDRDVMKNLNGSNIKTRPTASNGLYCCIILPLLMVIICIRYPVTTVYLMTTAMATGLLVSSVLLVLFLAVSPNFIHKRDYVGSLASGLLASLICFAFMGQGLFYSISICVLFAFAYTNGVRHALIKLPQCFTVGEAMLVLQGIVLFLFSAFVNLTHAVGKTPTKDSEIIAVIVQAGLLTVVVIVALCYFFNEPRQLGNLIKSSGGSILALLIWLHAVLGFSSILWILSFIFEKKRLFLISSWVICTFIAVVTLHYHLGKGMKASTSMRKIFHVLAVAVFLPGVLWDVQLISLASGIALAVLILVEVLRKLNIKPISNILNEAFKIYADEKDVGGLSLTPIYLLVGVSCPLALVPAHQGPLRKLQLLSGVLSIGIGDATASWMGSNYGRHRWNGSQRTVEGSIFNILSQFLTILILYYLDFLNGDWVLFRGAVASVVAATVEASTDQIDNLVLPIVTLISSAL